LPATRGKKKMNHDEPLVAVCCVHCNGHIFKFSKNLLEEYTDNVVYFSCPKCGKETLINYTDVTGLMIAESTRKRPYNP
jgi:predicted RNA-binding Zn-ribbon protein involved in translation (DUF1610 family)